MQQHEFLAQLVRLCEPGEVLYVTGEWHGAPTAPRAWDEWPWHRGKAAFRSLLRREVLFDFDQPDWPSLREAAERVSTKLQAVGCPYYLWTTGGKGLHINVFLEDNLMHHVASWNQIRLRFWEWATDFAALADRVKAVWRTYSLVRAEGAWRHHRPRTLDELFRPVARVKSYLETLPRERPAPRGPQFPDALQAFRLPEAFLLTLANENGLGDCPVCDIPLSPQGVALDSWADRVTGLTCAVCRNVARLAAAQHPLEGPWASALPPEWLPEGRYENGR